MAGQAPGVGRRLTWVRAAALLLLALIIVPWVVGMFTNSIQGWNRRIVFWGRRYTASGIAPDTQTTSAERPLPVVALGMGSTWLPNPLVAVDVQQAPTAFVVRLPSGRHVAYELVGGP